MSSWAGPNWCLMKDMGPGGKRITGPGEADGEQLGPGTHIWWSGKRRGGTNTWVVPCLLAHHGVSASFPAQPRAALRLRQQRGQIPTHASSSFRDIPHWGSTMSLGPQVEDTPPPSAYTLMTISIMRVNANGALSLPLTPFFNLEKDFSTTELWHPHSSGLGTPDPAQVQHSVPSDGNPSSPWKDRCCHATVWLPGAFLS